MRQACYVPTTSVLAVPRISATVQGVPASGIRRIFEPSSRMPDVIQLSVGEPQLPVAEHIRAAAALAWREDRTGYTANSGILPLREAIAAKLTRHNGYTADISQIHVTAGGAQALHAALSFAVEPGGEVLVPDPGYSTFTMITRLLGATPVSYPLHAAADFLPDIAQLERLVTARTRAIVVNSPSNPLGVIFPRAVMEQLLAFAARHDLWVISDEVYEYLTYQPGFSSMASLDSEGRVLSVYSLSKTYGLTGGRIGYLVTPPGMDERFRAYQEAVVSCVDEPSQWAAVAAITGPQDGVVDSREHYRRNLAAATAALDERGFTYPAPVGAFYLWVDVSHASDDDVAAWAERFLYEQRVAVAPGTAFGAAGEGWIRLSCAGKPEPLVEAIRRLPAPPR